jgi:N-acetylmuramic acid 6-phosphate etherase
MPSCNPWGSRRGKIDDPRERRVAVTSAFNQQIRFRPLKDSAYKLAATERRNPRSLSLDQMPIRKLLLLINREDQLVPRAVERELASIARAVNAVVKAIEHGGRLIYVGAGTSGRLAALDAAECPPTFGVSARMVQAVVAGGRRALTRAAEDVEDSASQGAKDLAARKLHASDVVIGVTSSGRTPYVVGALQFARKRGAPTVLLTSNRISPASRFADITIAPQTGPEVIAGSTRMKAGTGQKLILNMLTTAAMIRLGRIYNNWMVDLSMTNEKLRNRGLRILTQATGASLPRAKRALAQSGSVRVALVMLKTRRSASQARRWLQQAGGNLARALAATTAAPRSTGAKEGLRKMRPRKKT